MKNVDDLENTFYLSKIEQKIFEIKGMYHPNLISNLSKEAYDLYLIRMSICDQLLEQLDKKGIKTEKIENFIRDKVKNIRKGLTYAKKIGRLSLLNQQLKSGKNF